MTDWLDQREYPFPSHYLDLEVGQMHYVDQGEGAAIVMVHGTPTWSFLYRRLITGLSRDFRAVAAQVLVLQTGKSTDLLYGDYDFKQSLADDDFVKGALERLR